MVSPIQAAVSAAVIQVIALIVAFGVIDNATAAVATTASAAVLNAVFLLVAELHHAHGAPVAKAKR